MSTMVQVDPKNKKREMLHWTSEMVSNFWDYYSQFDQEYFSKIHGSRIVKYFAPYLENEKIILDYGCGTGDLLEHLLAAGYACAGTDVSPESVGRVNARHAANKRFQGAFIRDEALRSGNCFDAAFVLEVVEHLYDPELADLLSTLKKLVRPGGLVLMTTPNEEDIESASILCPVSNKLFHPYQHVRSWSVKTLSQALEGYGLTIVACEAIHFRSIFPRMSGNIPIRPWLDTARFRVRAALRSKKKQPPHLIVVARMPS